LSVAGQGAPHRRQTEKRSGGAEIRAGCWRGTGPATLGTFSFTLNQDSGGRITGTYFDSTFGAGQLDPASTNNRIDAQGAIEMRVKQGPFTDFTFRAQMDQTGRRITGGVFGSGFGGQPITLTKD
jgi:hypothetical protein